MSGVTVYHDVGCDGGVSGDPVVTSLDLAADDFACVIVEGTIPTGTPNGNTGNLNLEGSSTGDVTQTDTDNWAQAEANTGGNLTADKSANPSGAVAEGDTISYLISGSNNGGGAAYGVDASSYTGTANEFGIVIEDILDANVTYQAGSLNGTAGAGTVELYYSTNGGTSWTATEPTAADVDAVAMVIVDPGAGTAFFTQSANYTMTFDVTVNTGLTAGTTVISNDAEVTYSPDGTTTNTTPTNTTNNPVAADYGVAIGPDGLAVDADLSDNGPLSYTDPVSGDTWNVALSGGFGAGDTQTITDAVVTGDTVAFDHTVQNTGNAADSFSVSAASAQGYTVVLYQADGVTPLVGPIGPLIPGATQNVVAKVTIPAGATLGDTLTLTVTSQNDAGQSDTTTDIIPAPTAGYAVDITDQADNDALGTFTADAGDTVAIPIKVTNDGDQNDTFDLSATLPTDWTVTFVADADCDGVPDGATVTVTPSLAPGEEACYVAQVVIPADATPSANNPIAFTATSNGDGAVSDAAAGTVNVGTTADLEFVNDQVATTSADSVVTYQHSVINNGNADATVTIPAQSGTQFTYQYAVDSDNDGDFSDETFYSELTGAQAFTVAPSDTQTVFVRVIVPGTATDGDTETVTVTATGSYPDGSSADASVQDTTIVQSAELDLNKSARTCADAACASVLDAAGATAEPGDYLEYTVEADNLGLGDLTNVRVTDPLPEFTNFVSASATTTLTGTELYSTDGTTWSTAAPTSLTAGQSIYVGVDTNADGDISAADTMPPGENITLTFVVQVQ